MTAEKGDRLHCRRRQPTFPLGEYTAKKRCRARRVAFIGTGFGAPRCGATRSRQEQKKDRGQPDSNTQNPELQRHIAGEVAGESEDRTGYECGHFPAGQPTDQHVGEEAGKKYMERGLHLQPVEPSRSAEVEACQDKQRIADRVEHGRLRVGKEGVAREGVGVPQGQPKSQNRRLLKQAEGQKMAGEITVREGGQAQ